MAALDETDRKILDLLQRDGRKTHAAIAEDVNLTAPSVFERVRKLEQRGVIRGYTARIDPAALGKSLTAIIRLTAAFDDRYDSGLKSLCADPDVLELYTVAGEDCFIIKTRVGNPEELQSLIDRIRSRLTVLRSVTMIVLNTFKEDALLNVLPQAAPARAKAARRR
jgi:Lrp/AsnC family leucine-responsive transcriptional regulator